MCIRDSLLVDIRAESQQTLNVTDETLFGSKGMEDAIQEHQQRLQNLYQQLLLCIRTRACGWQLLAAYPGEERLKTTRKRSIKEALELLAENGDLLSGTDHLMRKKVQSMSALFNRNVIVNQRKLDLLAWGDRLIGEVSQRREQIAEDLLLSLIHI